MAQKTFSYPLDLVQIKKTALGGAEDCTWGDDWDRDKRLKRMTDTHGSIGLTCQSGCTPTGQELFAASQKGVKLIIWHTAVHYSSDLKHALWEAANAGIWNHLFLDPGHDGDMDEFVQFALGNSNIVHSWKHRETNVPLPYAQVKPLPGKPLWMVLENPEQLLPFLHVYGRDAVGRWRVMEDGRRVEKLGGSIQFTFCKPGDLPVGYLEEICRMVAAGGSVDMDRVRYNLERAFLIAYATEFGVIVGNSSLKHPRKEYIKSLFENTGIDFSGYLERGYTSVRPEYRGLGIGTRLLEGLTKRTGGKKLYSIITEDNLATQKIAIRNRTRKLTTFFSQKTGKQVGVWVGNT